MPKAVKKKTVKKQKQIHYKHPFTIFTIAFVILLLLFITITESQKPQDQRSRADTFNCDITDTEIANDAEELKLLTLLNAYRQENGAPPLQTNPNLNRMAAWHAKDMATNNYLEHTDSLGRPADRRAAECESPYGAENIAMGSAFAEQTMQFWKESAGHKANMIDPKYKIVGIARAVNYWSIDFAVEDTSPTWTPTATTIPAPSVVPSPACLGTCPTLPPIVVPSMPTGTAVQPTQAVTSTPEIPENPGNPEPTEPSEQPENPKPGNPNPGNGGGNGGGIIELFLSLLKLILEFFQSLFK